LDSGFGRDHHTRYLAHRVSGSIGWRGVAAAEDFCGLVGARQDAKGVGSSGRLPRRKDFVAVARAYRRLAGKRGSAPCELPGSDRSKEQGTNPIISGLPALPVGRAAAPPPRRRCGDSRRSVRRARRSLFVASKEAVGGYTSPRPETFSRKVSGSDFVVRRSRSRSHPPSRRRASPPARTRPS
jgi:hypothetical protein